MRAIAEEAFAMVREYKGSHSGEHGDGLVRSEFHETMFGERLVSDFKEVKHRFDPDGVLNPGKIVDAPKMDDRSLFRFKPDYRVDELKTKLDWSAWPGAGGGFQSLHHRGPVTSFTHGSDVGGSLTGGLRRELPRTVSYDIVSCSIIQYGTVRY